MARGSTFKVVIVILVVSLCANIYFVVRSVSERAADYRGMSMVPYYLSLALVSYTIEFTMKNNPNVHALPGNPEVQMAFSSYQASRSLYDKYGYQTGYLYAFLEELESLPDDKAYHALLDIKPFLPDRQIRPSEIRPLLNA